MAGIKGSASKKEISYADTAIQNAAQEKEAMRLKKEEQARIRQQALQSAMVEMAETQPVVAETPPVVAETPPVVAETPPVVVETPPVVAETPPVVIESQATIVEPTPVVAEVTPNTDKANADKAKAKRNASKKDVAEIASFSEGTIQFNGQFLIKETKSKEFSTIGFSAPVDIALEAKVKAARDKLSLFELNNLLLAFYLEKGIPKEFLERYRKSFN